MISHYPSYYKKFNCIASKCKNSCCSAGWEILIDKHTAEFYKSISGEFGDKLRSKIDFSENTKFILDSSGKCPFLNDNNLCDIYINLGQEHLCQICTEHPRFYECFNDFVECGLGIYCEEACRIILSQNEKFNIYEEETLDTIDCEYDEKVFNYLITNRKKIFEYLADTSITINQRIADVLWFANTLQQNIDSDMLDEEELFNVSSVKDTSIEPLLKYLLDLEPNDSRWFDYLNKSLEIYQNNFDKFDLFEKENPNISVYLQNLANYYIYRYFLRSIYDEDVLSSVKFMAFTIAIIKTLFFCKWIEKGSLDFEDCIYIVKKYAEEIECNDDNILNIHISCYEIGNFSTENLLSLFV